MCPAWHARIIPFGPSNRLRTAYIINLHSDNNENENIKYKEIHEIVDHEPLLTEEMIKLVLWMKRGIFVHMAMPYAPCFHQN